MGVARRYQRLSTRARRALQWSCFEIWKLFPNLTDGQVQEVLLQLGWTWLTGGHDSAGRVRIHRLRKLALNYTQKGQYTFSFLTYIPAVPRQHVKYLDECAFVERDLHPTRGCRSLPGERVVIHSYIREEEQSSYEGRYIVSAPRVLLYPVPGAM
eukprot:g19645.t1